SVITADTVVCMAGEILGKPKSEQEAFAMLKKLKGKTHAVITAVAFTDMADKACYVFSDKTEVTFAPWADAVLEAYAKTGEGFDKAGAYGISGTGSFLSSSVHGCLDTVIGLPVAKCVEFLLWNGAITI
ncbi:MAG: Maf family protein, partial [Mailhella sp.]|nr:Maf family protein [Mailhella sp.]